MVYTEEGHTLWKTGDNMTVLFTGIHQRNKGISAWKFDKQEKNFEHMYNVNDNQNITYLCKSMDNHYLFAAGEENGCGVICAYRISSLGERLQLVVKYVYSHGSFSHLQCSKNGSILFASCYSSGEVLVFRFLYEKEQLLLIKVFRFQGNGPVKGRQEGSHPHSVYLSPDEKVAIISDLGADRLFILSIEKDQEEIKLAGEWQTVPGMGPRHIAFHPQKKICYLLTELSSEICVLKYDNDILNCIQVLSSLPSKNQKDNLAADIAVSRDGRMLYVSNRGFNGISVFDVDGCTGKIQMRLCVPTKGWGRAIQLSEREDWLFVLDEEYADSLGGLEAFPMYNGLPEEKGFYQKCSYAYTFCAIEPNVHA